MIRTDDRGTFVVVASEPWGEGAARARACEIARAWAGPVTLLLAGEADETAAEDVPANLDVLAVGGEAAAALGPKAVPHEAREAADALLRAATRRGRLEQVVVQVGASEEGLLTAFSDAAFPVPVTVELNPSAGLPEASWLWEHADDVVLPDEERLYQLANGQPALPVRVVPPGVDGEQRAWIEHPALGARPRVSVVVPVRGNAELVNRMAASVVANTPDLLELILIEDASPDRTLPVLERMAAREPRLRLLVNREQRGFAASCNRGLVAARGDLVIVLNADTVVTPQWAERLDFHLAVQPKAGIVGPVSNRVSGLQQLAPVDYDERTLVGLVAFADQVYRLNTGRARGVVRLTGLCVAFARPALRRVGGFDPRFFPGNYEDDDWCLRLIAAGLVPYCADDVFIHHEGSRSFALEATAYGRLLEDNWSRFREKWGLPPDRPRERHYSPEELRLQPYERARHFIPPWVAVEPLRR